MVPLPPPTPEVVKPSQARVCPTCQLRYDLAAQFCPKDGSPLILEGKDENGSSLVGQVLADRYRIVRMIGEGGMGQVYEADHVYINKKFALKLLRPEITGDPEAVARFHQEARAAASIGHESIVEIDDFGRLADGSVYLAMEYLQGDSLAELMQKAPLDIREGLGYLVQVCDGLAVAHDKGIVHRDMKPENVFITNKSGNPPRRLAKILDFGIAKVTGADAGTRLTRTGAVFGTPHYMSPEQALGKSLDARSDIYAVGVITYEVCTGSVPFQAETFMGILTQHLTQPPVPPRTKAPGRNIPIPVEDIILKAMAKEPEQRYQSIADLGLDLRAALEGRRPHASGPLSAGMASAVAARVSAQNAVAPEGSDWTVPEEMPSGLREAGLLAPSGSHEVVARPVTVPPPGRGGSLALPIAIGAGLVLALGGGAVVYTLRKPVTPTVNVPPREPQQTASQVVLRLESDPPAAEVLDGSGKIIGATPVSLLVPTAGTPIDVTLHLGGYSDKLVHLLPPTDGKSLVVSLEKSRAGHEHTPTVERTPDTHVVNHGGSHHGTTPPPHATPPIVSSPPPVVVKEPPHTEPRLEVPSYTPPPATPRRKPPQTPQTPKEEQPIDPYN